MSEPKKRLNLGCGQFKKAGYLNVDWDPRAEPDLLWDLSKIPYPFEDNSFERIEMDHVLEHLSSPFDVMREIHRILAPSGECIIRVPHFSRAMTHPQHKCGFDFTFPMYFDPRFPGGYAGVTLEILSVWYTWSAQPHIKKIALSKPLYLISVIVSRIFDSLANLSPMLCSRVWCFWVGGFEEIKFHFRKPQS